MMETLGKRIKFIRGWRSQEVFATMLNIHRTTLASWEIDRRRPDIDSLKKIAKICNVTLDWLLNGNEIAATIESFHTYNNHDWQKFIEFADSHQIAPEGAMRILKKFLDFGN